MNAIEYKKRHEELMTNWELEAREWIRNEVGGELSATFFRDGIIDPDTWFRSDFRPLFILKEVHDKAQENRCINFVAMQEGADYDIWERKGMWHAFGTLAKGMIVKIKSKGSLLPYEEVYAEDLEHYHETLRQIAIINIKKLSGGSSVDSEASNQTKHFSCHACKFKANLQRQIELIQPTLIICCGANIEQYFDIQNGYLYNIPVVIGLHPATNPNRRREEFYNGTIENVQKALLGNIRQSESIAP